MGKLKINFSGIIFSLLLFIVSCKKKSDPVTPASPPPPPPPTMTAKVSSDSINYTSWSANLSISGKYIDSTNTTVIQGTKGDITSIELSLYDLHVGTYSLDSTSVNYSPNSGFQYTGSVVNVFWGAPWFPAEEGTVTITSYNAETKTVAGDFEFYGKGFNWFSVNEKRYIKEGHFANVKITQ